PRDWSSDVCSSDLLAHSSLTVHLSFATDSFCRVKGLRGNKPPPPAHSHLNQKRGRSFSYVRSQHAFETNPDRSPSRAGCVFLAGRSDRSNSSRPRHDLRPPPVEPRGGRHGTALDAAGARHSLDC